MTQTKPAARDVNRRIESLDYMDYRIDVSIVSVPTDRYWDFETGQAVRIYG